MIRKLLISSLLVTLVCAAAWAGEPKSIVSGPPGSQLTEIARVAADAQSQAEEMEAYVRNDSVDWRTLAYQTADLADQARTLQNLVSGFEGMQPTLTPAQSNQFDLLKAGLEILPAFLNKPNHVL